MYIVFFFFLMQMLTFDVLGDLCWIIPNTRACMEVKETMIVYKMLTPWINGYTWLLCTLWWFVIFGKYLINCTNGSAQHSKLLFENEMQGTKNIHSWLRYFQDGIKCYYPEEKILLFAIYMNTNNFFRTLVSWSGGNLQYGCFYRGRR